jgi:hypothetical protein
MVFFFFSPSILWYNFFGKIPQNFYSPIHTRKTQKRISQKTHKLFVEEKQK